MGQPSGRQLGAVLAAQLGPEKGRKLAEKRVVLALVRERDLVGAHFGAGRIVLDAAAEGLDQALKTEVGSKHRHAAATHVGQEIKRFIEVVEVALRDVVVATAADHQAVEAPRLRHRRRPLQQIVAVEGVNG